MSTYPQETKIRKPYKLIIPGQLPGLNEYIEAERANKYKAAKLKENTESYIFWSIKSQLKGLCIAYPVFMSYNWIEPNKRRDKDNISFARKFVQDALVKAGVLKNDGWNQIDGFEDSFNVDKLNPRVEIEIGEADIGKRDKTETKKEASKHLASAEKRKASSVLPSQTITNVDGNNKSKRVLESEAQDSGRDSFEGVPEIGEI